jgi:hypothetical protein
MSRGGIGGSGGSLEYDGQQVIARGETGGRLAGWKDSHHGCGRIGMQGEIYVRQGNRENAGSVVSEQARAGNRQRFGGVIDADVGDDRIGIGGPQGR